MSLSSLQDTLSVSLSSMVADLCTPEHITARCPTPGCQSEEARSIRRWKTPPELLLVHLKRWAVGSSRKITTPVDVEEMIEVTDDQHKLSQYELLATLVHVGRLATGGHYIAVLRQAAGWLVCDDAQFTTTACRWPDSDQATTILCLYQKSDEADLRNVVIPVRSPVELRTVAPAKRYSDSWLADTPRPKKRRRDETDKQLTNRMCVTDVPDGALLLSDDDTVENVISIADSSTASVDERPRQYGVLGEDHVSVVDRSAELLNVLEQIQGTYMVPIRNYIPEKFWPYLPDNFLNSAAVDNYGSEELLRPFFSTTIVHPSLGRNFEIDFVTKNPLIMNLKDSVTPALFDIMLSYDHIYNMEYGIVDSET